MNLAINDANAAAIAAAGGIAPLVELARSGSAGAKEQAAGALWNLAHNDANQVAIAAAGGIAPLVELVRSGSAGAKEPSRGGGGAVRGRLGKRGRPGWGNERPTRWRSRRRAASRRWSSWCAAAATAPRSTRRRR